VAIDDSALLPLPTQYLPTGRHHVHKVLGSCTAPTI
jgi:hypothetical protein